MANPTQPPRAVKRYHVYLVKPDGGPRLQLTPTPAPLEKCQLLIKRQQLTTISKFIIEEDLHK